MEKSFREISDILDSALKDLAEKKTNLDKANDAASSASTDYNNAVSKAQSLRLQLTQSLETVLPAYNDNVKVMGGR